MAVAVKINGSKGNYSNDGNDKGNYYKWIDNNMIWKIYEYLQIETF